MELKRQLQHKSGSRGNNLPISRLEQGRELCLEYVSGDRRLVGARVIEQNNRRWVLTSQILSHSLL